MTTFGRMFSTAFAALSFAAMSGNAATAALNNNNRLSAQVRHELVMLPYLSVFDNLEYRVDGTRVILLGQVIRPTLRSSAERVVERIEGVSGVENRIEVLPLSTFDNRLRIALYRAVYGNPAMLRYRMPVHAPIRIVVRNGDVTLKGVVDSEMDRNLAGIYANGVSGVFSVTNDLRVVRS